MKATTLSLWCISTSTIAYTHAFVRISDRHRRFPRVTQIQQDGEVHNIPTQQYSTQNDTQEALDTHRRKMLFGLLSLPHLSLSCWNSSPSYAAVPPELTTEKSSNKSSPFTIINGIHDPHLQNYCNPLLPNWKGTALPGPLSISEAHSQLILPSLENKSTSPTQQQRSISRSRIKTTFPMARWPDPILRKSASPIPRYVFQNEEQLTRLQLVAETLRNTARKEGAVGLAAQQCGIDASLIFIDGVVVVGTSSKGTNQEVVTTRKNGILSDIAAVSSILGGIFGQTDWRNSKKQVTGEGVIDEYNNDRSLLQRFDHSATILGKQPSQTKKDGIFLVNPRIIYRSPESEMLVWTEECLVLPPEFKATLLRDASVTIEYETLVTSSDGDVDGQCGETKQITLWGEYARCAQHEMDHDKGILIVDHVGLEELLSVRGQALMADVEDSDGLHGNRMQRAFARQVDESTLLPSAKTHKNVDLAFGDSKDFVTKIEYVESSDLIRREGHPWFVQSANAVENIPEKSAPYTESTRADRIDGATTTCDEACIEERKRRIQQRRAMMQQSRSSTSRGEVLELSRQRALMYGTSYNGLSPSACANGFCP